MTYVSPNEVELVASLPAPAAHLTNHIALVTHDDGSGTLSPTAVGIRVCDGVSWNLITLISVGSAGSFQNVADIAAMQALVVTSLLDGTHCWVRSVQRAFILTTVASSTDTVKDTYLSLTAGRFWIGTAHTNTRYWMQQVNWFIDDSASVENTGLDAAHPIPETERQARMGPRPIWNAGAYHIFLAGALTSDIVLVGTSFGSTIYVHGSGTAHVGASTLYSGTIDAGTVAQNQATNVPWRITSSGIATSWTASSLVGQRIRIVGGARDGAIAWAMADLGTKQARVCEFNINQNLTQTSFAANFSLATPVNGDSFVVESLKAITTRISCSVIGGGSTHVVFDGLDLSTTLFNCAGTRITLCGCRAPTAVSNPPNFVFLLGSRVFSGISSFVGATQTRILGGFVLGQAVLTAATCQYFVDHFMAQGDGTSNTGVTCHQTPGADVPDSGAINIDSIGAFDCTFLLWNGGGTVICDDNLLLWGSNNTNTLVIAGGGAIEYIGAGGVLTAAMFPAAALSGDVSIGGRTSMNVFDRDINLWTNPRTLSWTNILATIANGGFCQSAGLPRILDPSTGARFTTMKS